VVVATSRLEDEVVAAAATTPTAVEEREVVPRVPDRVVDEVELGVASWLHVWDELTESSYVSDVWPLYAAVE
jgi:antirestriction protein ArdC